MHVRTVLIARSWRPGEVLSHNAELLAITMGPQEIWSKSYC